MQQARGSVFRLPHGTRHKASATHTDASCNDGMPAPLILQNVRKSDLLSKEWCDLVFDKRNRDYGAYRIRKNTGRRYRLALIVVLCAVILLVIVPFGLDLYTKYKTLTGLKGIEADIKELAKADKKDGFERKRISAGRAAPKVSTIKGASDDKPDIVETTKQEIVFGVHGTETVIVEEQTTIEDRDTIHNRKQTELPIEGPQLTAVEIVEEMPQFPGGPKALMEWLDAHIPYPPACIRQKIEGDMELTFLVDRDGNVIEPSVSKSLHPELDRVALGAFKVMPRWKPGRSNGKLSVVRVTIPLHFQLR